MPLHLVVSFACATDTAGVNLLVKDIQEKGPHLAGPFFIKRLSFLQNVHAAEYMIVDHQQRHPLVS